VPGVSAFAPVGASAPYLPEQALSMEDCLRFYTAAGAYCSGEGHLKGQIRAGQLADFIFLDRDLLTADKKTVPQTQVLATYIDGRCVWRRE
jgi:predicted amidohydrolase YtcJ